MPKATERIEKKTETTFDAMEKLQCGRQCLPDGLKSRRYVGIFVDSDNEHHEFAAIR